ncbi:MAG: ABC transporter permease [Firmicutes bacterium]|nr:ABC transporter permease [Bacillota bacterium]
MFTYIRKRLISLVIVLFGITVLSFLLSNISPVDPAEAYASRVLKNPTPEKIEEIRLEMGLNLPLYQQYINWIGNCLKGDLGTSLLTKNPVSYDIAQKMPATIQLVALALFFIVISFIPISVISAVRKNSLFDHFVKGVSILGISIPSFWLGFLLLLIFAVTFPIFEVVDYGNIRSLILPALVLAIPAASSFIRLFRATVLSNLNKDYVVYAKARGISTNRIVWGHVLKNSLPPIVTLFFQNLGYMLAGSAVVESVFSLKGIGLHLLNAVMARDLPTINGCVLIIALIFVFCSILADGINMVLNPRMIEREEALYE